MTSNPWGATASYGMGELTLLAFDATKDPGASDEWVRLKLVDLTRHAWDRQVSLVLPHGASALDTGSLDAIRKHLDPNEGARWAVGETFVEAGSGGSAASLRVPFRDDTDVVKFITSVRGRIARELQLCAFLDGQLKDIALAPEQGA